MFRICRIISETEESTIRLKEYLGGYPVEITQQIPEENYFDIPTLMLGWNSVKNRFPGQKIHESKILNNLVWTYNESECKEIKDESYYKNIEKFINDNLKNWLPSDFILFDSLMHGDFSSFINSNINRDFITYVHFDNGALYMRNRDRNYIINAKSLWLTENSYRDKITEVLNT